MQYNAVMMEFGKRRPVETAKPAQSERTTETDFAKERPMYERVRAQHPDIDSLLRDWDNIDAHQGGVHALDDERQKRRIEKSLDSKFHELTS